MIHAWDSPRSLEIGGVFYAIRYDYRAILDILCAFRDPNLEMDERWAVCFEILFEDEIPAEDMEEAAKKAMWFINCGREDEDDKHAKMPEVMDWEQDGYMIIRAVNKVAGRDVTESESLHWWTFVGYYMEIGESTFSTVLSIRQKKAKGKKLEKWEQEFYRENKDIVDIQAKLTDEEREEEKRLNEQWNW